MSPPLLPPVIRALLIANIALFLLEQTAHTRSVDLFALWPLHTPYFRAWQPITYAFFHNNPAHLTVNMIGLWLFGRPLEKLWGSRRVALYYLACVLTAAATQLLLQSDQAVIGASGGVFGLLLGCAWYFRHVVFELRAYPRLGLPVWVLVALGAGVELYAGVKGKPRAANFAHLGGMLGGALSILYWQARRRFSAPTAP
jgi:membrane associated rhomboid family serine protease